MRLIALDLDGTLPELEMMRVAGISIAMGNAPDEVKSQVDIVGIMQGFRMRLGEKVAAYTSE